MNEEMRKLIEQAWESRELLNENAVQEAVREAVALLDSGKLRIAEKAEGG